MSPCIRCRMRRATDDAAVISQMDCDVYKTVDGPTNSFIAAIFRGRAKAAQARMWNREQGLSFCVRCVWA